ncbi:hypothetical protein BAUCODRAFT_149732 [Baudoinia panamericana UAMH 10762]|uniref:Adenosine deaminase domain-containing protein n=1 Tax=Baudoinia panamericana (strain UAMH 10762) TaxID=717646 RepID=M2LK34_BAUPA|nr:uncharacterized protein BAUCODRAFT_149732 [Baudoinia panamericana UAMH 10762]EMC94597.1 hypothetical protein BAUCODRAFT_149732 [Baudoinia panamericana UAMH 10762]
MLVDIQFVTALPKAELHAHLSGSISRDTLHDIWVQKRQRGQFCHLDDPLDVIQPGHGLVDVVSFFPLFDRYIYELVNDVETVQRVTKRVIEDFALDGVRYLELRTTPREAPGFTKAEYVAAVHDAIVQHAVAQRRRSDSDESAIDVRLILCIDRRMSLSQAHEVVDLALHYQHHEQGNSSGAGKVAQAQDGLVVAVDLCGNPAKGDVFTFSEAFARVKVVGLGVTVHFAEIPQSGAETELETLLSWKPDRLGHVIHVPEKFKYIIEERKLGLELCLSCNVLAKLTMGSYADHHLAKWRKTQCSIALCTDDVAIFGSPLSNEYLLAAEHHGLDHHDLIALSRSAASIAFSGRERMRRLIDSFEQTCDSVAAVLEA